MASAAASFLVVVACVLMLGFSMLGWGEGPGEAEVTERSDDPFRLCVRFVDTGQTRCWERLPGDDEVADSMVVLEVGDCVLVDQKFTWQGGLQPLERQRC